MQFFKDKFLQFNIKAFPTGHPRTNRDGMSLCPGTWAGAKIPGQTPLSPDKITIKLAKKI